jgi:hypothetical protein
LESHAKRFSFSVPPYSINKSFGFISIYIKVHYEDGSGGEAGRRGGGRWVMGEEREEEEEKENEILRRK